MMYLKHKILRPKKHLNSFRMIQKPAKGHWGPFPGGNLAYFHGFL